MPSQIFPFDFLSNYRLSDSNKLQITGGNVLLKLIDDPDNDFNEDFADDTGHTYESDKSEFSGGQNQQINKRPTDAIFYAPYTNDENAAWSVGSGAGTLVNGSYVEDGYLKTNYTSLRYCSYAGAGNTTAQQGNKTIVVQPQYSGNPPYTNWIYTECAAIGSLHSMLQLYHDTAGILRLNIYDENGASIMLAALGGWNPTAGQDYEISIDPNVTDGLTQVRIDGVQIGSDQTATGTRDISEINFIFLGTSHNANPTDRNLNWYRDVLFYSTVQHTSDYTPNWSDIYEYDYLATYDLLPEMHYTGAGTLIEATNFLTSFSGSPRIAIDIGQSGDYTYWTGTEWDTGGDDYDHATSPADFLANIATLPVNGETYGQFIIYYPNSFSQSAFADLTITLTSQIYPTDNPYLDINSRWYLDDLEALTEGSPVTSGSDEIKYILKQGSTWYYHDGSDWTESDGTYSQANTASEIDTYKSNFIDSRIYFAVRMFLHSADGSTTPTLGTLTIQYSYAGETPDTINECIVWGIFIDELGEPNPKSIDVYLTDKKAKYKTSTMIRRKSTPPQIIPDSTGYGEISLVETENMNGSGTYTFDFGDGDLRRRAVPDEETANFFELESE